MLKLLTWAGKSSFEYSGSVKDGTTIVYGKGFSVKVPAAEYLRLLNFSKEAQLK